MKIIHSYAFSDIVHGKLAASRPTSFPSQLRLTLFAGVLMIFCAMSGGAVKAEENALFVEPGNGGLIGLEYLGTSLFSHDRDGVFMVFNRSPIFASPEPVADGGALHAPVQMIQNDDRDFELIYSWGSIATVLTESSNRLDFKITVENTTDTNLEKLYVRLCRLSTPGPEDQSRGQTSVMISKTTSASPYKFTGTGADIAFSPDEIPAVLIACDTYSVLICADQFTDEFQVGAYVKQPGAFVPGACFINIPPHEKRTAIVSLRFGKPGATLDDLGEELWDNRFNPIP